MIVKLIRLHGHRCRSELYQSVVLPRLSPAVLSSIPLNISISRQIFTERSTKVNASPLKLLTQRTFHLSSNVYCNQNQQTENDKRLVLTDRCLHQLNQVLEPGEYIRVGVRGGGCSGFEYEISVNKESEITQEDLIIEGRVIVDRESIEYMNGAKLDYEDELIRSGFRVIDNPYADKGCSCGASFSFKF